MLLNAYKNFYLFEFQEEFPEEESSGPGIPEVEGWLSVRRVWPSHIGPFPQNTAVRTERWSG
jgi:hypothetical protein